MLTLAVIFVGGQKLLLIGFAVDDYFNSFKNRKYIFSDRNVNFKCYCFFTSQTILGNFLFSFSNYHWFLDTCFN